MNPLAQTLKTLAETLDRIGIAYAIGGSLASSARGTYRATNDIDLVAVVVVRQSDRLAKELGGQWYAEPDQMRQAIAARRAFNLIHISLGIKVDIFPAVDDFHLVQLERATRVVLPFLDDTTRYPVTTAEDILLAKLRWYRDGGEVSEKQWTDIEAIIAANPSMDLTHLETWAVRLQVPDLLDRALRRQPRGAQQH
jgi:hypothetical protein